MKLFLLLNILAPFLVLPVVVPTAVVIPERAIEMRKSYY